MYVLLACSAFAVAVILERLAFWLVEKKRVSLRSIETLVDSVIRGEAPPSATSQSSIVGRLTADARSGGVAALTVALRFEAERTYERAVKHLTILDTVVSIAPLLGILGTVLGIMRSFHALDMQHLSSPGEVGHGLAEALITTATGLIIAVPALVVYNLLLSMAGRHASSLFKFAQSLEVKQETDQAALRTEPQGLASP